jgi:hypothetical protein
VVKRVFIYFYWVLLILIIIDGKSLSFLTGYKISASGIRGYGV